MSAYQGCAGHLESCFAHRPCHPPLPQVVEFEGVDARYSVKQLRDSDRQGLEELEGQAQPDGL